MKELWCYHLTEGGRSEHAIELPFLGVPDDVSRVTALLGAMEHRPPEVSFAQQAEHTQLPVDLHRQQKDVKTHKQQHLYEYTHQESHHF